jgi:hypothetical protein
MHLLEATGSIQNGGSDIVVVVMQMLKEKVLSMESWNARKFLLGHMNPGLVKVGHVFQVRQFCQIDSRSTH